MSKPKTKSKEAKDLRSEIKDAEAKNKPRRISILRYSQRALERYGKYVIEDRALPDFRDGLKPVHRRLLWAMHTLSLGPASQRKKSARLIGDVIGKYHPHGDTACYEALVTVAGCDVGDNCPLPLADGEGGWFVGIMKDTASAMRYTNVRMSKFASQNFFNNDYIATIDKVPNFDGTEVEPSILPSMLPQLLLNGAFGIAYGVQTRIPSYTADSLKQVVIQLLEKKELHSKDYAKILKFNYEHGGGECISTTKELVDMYKNSVGKASFKSLYHWDEAKRKMTFYSFAPGVNVPNIQLTLLGRKENKKSKPPAWIKHIADALDESNRKDGPIFSVVFKKNSSKSEIDHCKKMVEEIFSSTQTYRINITERIYKGNTEDEDVRLHATTIPKLLTKWVDWRVDIEMKMLKHKLGVNAAQQKRTELHIFACDNLDVILKSLREDDPDAYLVKHLKISAEDASSILELKVRQLSKLDKKKLESNLDDLKKIQKQLISHQKNPNEKIISDLNAWKIAG